MFPQQVCFAPPGSLDPTLVLPTALFHWFRKTIYRSPCRCFFLILERWTKTAGMWLIHNHNVWLALGSVSKAHEINKILSCSLYTTCSPMLVSSTDRCHALCSHPPRLSAVGAETQRLYNTFICVLIYCWGTHGNRTLSNIICGIVSFPIQRLILYFLKEYI